MTCWGLHAYEAAELAFKAGASVPKSNPWGGMGFVGIALMQQEREN